MNVNKIYEKVQEKIAELDKICDFAKKDGNRALTNDEVKEFNSAMAEAKKLKSELAEKLKSSENLRGLIK